MPQVSPAPDSLRPLLAKPPKHADEVRATIADISPIADGSINDLDRLDEDLALGLRERLHLGRVLAKKLSGPVNMRVVLRAQTVADLMTSLS